MAVRERPTLKQARFAKAYVQEGNATEAVIRAGYKIKNRRVACAVGTENLSKPVIQREIMNWEAFLEAERLPSLQVVKTLRDKSDNQHIRLAASRDLLNRAGVGKHLDRTTNVVQVFSSMSEEQLLAKMAAIKELKTAGDNKEDETLKNS